jgi:hypothetical protein
MRSRSTPPPRLTAVPAIAYVSTSRTRRLPFVPRRCILRPWPRLAPSSASIRENSDSDSLRPTLASYVKAVDLQKLRPTFAFHCISLLLHRPSTKNPASLSSLLTAAPSPSSLHFPPKQQTTSRDGAQRYSLDWQLLPPRRHGAPHRCVGDLPHLGQPGLPAVRPLFLPFHF